METFFNRLVPENRLEYEHTLEGADDMPAHAKSTLSGVNITIPITDGRLNLGTWQGIYFCEFRNYGGLEALTRSIALEVAKYGITVNCVAPGPTQTGWIDTDLEQSVLPVIPMGKLIKPEDIAETILGEQE